jgi:myosin heavy subunit
MDSTSYGAISGERLKLAMQPGLDGISVANVAEMLGVSGDAFQDACTVGKTIGRPASAAASFFGSPSSDSLGSTKLLTEQQALDSVAALVKFAYSQLFAWLVAKINVAHAAAPDNSNNNKAAETLPAFIGILDIFGFEIMAVNSFEQLCINYANEVLQQQFNQTIFVREQAVYVEEGLDWSQITFRDNQGIIDLIAGKKLPNLGLLLRTEEFVRGATTNQGVFNNSALIKKMNDEHADVKADGSRDEARDESFYGKSRCYADREFTIRHFAGTSSTLPRLVVDGGNLVSLSIAAGRCHKCP